MNCLESIEYVANLRFKDKMTPDQCLPDSRTYTISTHQQVNDRYSSSLVDLSRISTRWLSESTFKSSVSYLDVQNWLLAMWSFAYLAKAATMKFQSTTKASWWSHLSILPKWDSDFYQVVFIQAGDRSDRFEAMIGETLNVFLLQIAGNILIINRNHWIHHELFRDKSLGIFVVSVSLVLLLIVIDSDSVPDTSED